MMPTRRHRTRTQSADSDDSHESQQGSSQPLQKKSKKITKARKNLTTSTDTNSQVCNESDSDVNADVGSIDECLQLKQQVRNLSELIGKQANEILTLNLQMKSILNYIGIENISGLNNFPTLSSQSASAAMDASLSLQISAASKNDSETTSVVQTNNSTTENINNDNYEPKMTSMMNNGSNLCQTVVTAMYVEQKQKDRRANSFVVSGLPIEEDIDDEKKIKHICKNDIGIDIEGNIASVKRIGKPRPEKVQPVLVILKDKQYAQNIVHKARLLRHSHSDYVRQFVYINTNMTRAESSAAYLLRCQRREHNTTRTATVSSHDIMKTLNHNSTNINASAPLQSTLTTGVPTVEQ